MTEILTQRTLEQFGDHIALITPNAVSRLRFPWDGRFSPRELGEIARADPPLSVWNRQTGEFLAAGPWRHRVEVATILELGATGGAIELIDAFSHVCGERGIRLIVASEQAERRRREFYVNARFDLLDEIIIYELSRVRQRAPQIRDLRFVQVNSDDATMMDELMNLDHKAFPWVWWNSREEFLEYLNAPGVRIDVGYDSSGRAMAYVGITRYRSWGHLDRIAVAPDAQGRGYGRAALDYAVMTLAGAGARRVGLSTQARNTRSRALYESYGFRRGHSNDYHLYGRALDSEIAGKLRNRE